MNDSENGGSPPPKKKTPEDKDIVEGVVVTENETIEGISLVSNAAIQLFKFYIDLEAQKSENEKAVSLKNIQAFEGLEKRDFWLRVAYFAGFLIFVFSMIAVSVWLLSLERTAEGIGILVGLIAALGGFGIGIGVGSKRGKGSGPS